jgi:quaternary ammonium compound-resistance protein SugE
VKLAAFTLTYTTLATLGLVVLRRTLADASLTEVVRTPSLYAGGLLYAASFATFLASLRSFEVLTVFPLFTGVTYATVTVAAAVVLDEHLSASRLAGIALVAVGAVLLVR